MKTYDELVKELSAAQRELRTARHDALVDAAAACTSYYEHKQDIFAVFAVDVRKWLMGRAKDELAAQAHTEKKSE